MPRDARNDIVHASWELFRTQGFRHTTVDQIIARAGIAKGTFYHHFQSKSKLLGALSDIFDDKYRKLETGLDQSLSIVDQIKSLNIAMFTFIQDTVPVDLLRELLASQLSPRGDRSLVNHDRYYFAIHRKFVARGQEAGEFTSDVSAHDIVRLYAMAERSMLYDWCLHQGAQPLVGEPNRIVAGVLDQFVTSD